MSLSGVDQLLSVYKCLGVESYPWETTLKFIFLLFLLFYSNLMKKEATNGEFELQSQETAIKKQPFSGQNKQQL